jgi:hypothetical protein
MEKVEVKKVIIRLMGEGGKEIKNIRKREIELGKRREVREGR